MALWRKQIDIQTDRQTDRLNEQDPPIEHCVNSEHTNELTKRIRNKLIYKKNH